MTLAGATEKAATAKVARQRTTAAAAMAPVGPVPVALVAAVRTPGKVVLEVVEPRRGAEVVLQPVATMPVATMLAGTILAGIMPAVPRQVARLAPEPAVAPLAEITPAGPRWWARVGRRPVVPPAVSTEVLAQGAVAAGTPGPV